MKFKFIILLGIGLLAATANAGDITLLKTLQEKKNYAIGVNIIRNLRQQGVDLDIAALIQGMKDACIGNKLLMPDSDISVLISMLQNDLNQKQINDRAMATKAYAFLEENKKKEGIVTLSDGLQYKILKTADGKKPTDADMVELNYKGAHIDGTEFVNSYQSGKLVTFKIAGGTIPGLCEALKLMSAGSRWRIFIPPHLAYGERGLSPNIGPFETLVYEVELISIR